MTEVFTGRYVVVGSSERRLRGDDGWYEVRLAVDGRGSVSAFDS